MGIITHFLKNLPVFENKFNILNKAQIRQVVEKTKFVTYKRGTTLVKQDKYQKYAYIIMLGIINLYDVRFTPAVQEDSEEDGGLFITQPINTNEHADHSLNIIK